MWYGWGGGWRREAERGRGAQGSLQSPWERSEEAALAMGKDGLLSRLAGECFGSCITFAKDSKGSAPGQVPFAELNVAMDFVHRWIG